MQPKFVSEAQVASVISWPLVNQAVEEALKSVCHSEKPNDARSYCQQPARSITPKPEEPNGCLFTMPGFVGNYQLGGYSSPQNTLACKLVTSFKGNESRSLPSILANILLFDSETGRLQCVMEGTDITARRTAAASVVATKHLYLQGKVDAPLVLAIVGCGVQGRIHAIAFCSTFNVTEVRLWNRTASKVDLLVTELDALKEEFVNKNIKITSHLDVADCVAAADVIVTGTYCTQPLVHLKELGDRRVHINAVGAGQVHHSELSQDIYDCAEVYIDNWASAKTELKDLKANIVCEVGEMINDKKFPGSRITVFQSMGMAAEDACVAQAVYNALF